MGAEQPHEIASELASRIAGQFTAQPEPAEESAWEEVAAGRYMPRRIKGSCKGRALG